MSEQTAQEMTVAGLGCSPKFRIGSEEHKRAFCRMLLDTHDPYKPAVIDWPELSPEAFGRLTALPIWNIAVQIEGRASIAVKTYGDSITDPLLKEAVLMDGGEEARHKDVLSKMVASYGIVLDPEPNYPPPADPEWAFMATGYAECIDSFFAFGLFKAAKDTGYFPPELVQTFDPVVNEEARHILFFVNWAAWHRRNLSWWRRIRFDLRVIAVWAFLVWERIGIARGLDAQGNAQDANFAMNGSDALGMEVSPGRLIAACLAANEARMSGYDPRLLRPTVVPRLARWAGRFLKP